MAVSFPGVWGNSNNTQHPLENTAFQEKSGCVKKELRGGIDGKRFISPGKGRITATARHGSNLTKGDAKENTSAGIMALPRTEGKRF
jgi:hypothetical protein